MSSADQRDEGVRQAIATFGLEGRRLYLPQMPYGGSYLLAAAIRSIGFEAWPTTDSDERTLDLGGRVTSGDECYPQKITMGDFLRVIEDEGRDKIAFLMPTANGPCRFGQYLHLIRAKFEELGYGDVPVIASRRATATRRSATTRRTWCARRGGRCCAATCSEDAAQDAALRAREGRRRRDLPAGARGGRRGDQPARRVQQGAPRRDPAGDVARPRPVQGAARRLRAVAAAHRHRRRDLLSPQPSRTST